MTFDGEKTETTEDAKAGLKGTRFALYGGAFAALALIWLIWGLDISDAYLRDHAESWFGKPSYDVPDWFDSFWFIVTGVGPAIVLGLISSSLFAAFGSANRSLVHAERLKELGRARVALQSAIVSVNEIEQQYKLKFQALEAVQKELSELEATKALDVASLQKMLNAIEQASLVKIWIGRFAAFVFGVASSILASYIWEKVL